MVSAIRRLNITETYQSLIAMRTILTRIFSAALATTTALSMVAAAPAAKKLSGNPVSAQQGIHAVAAAKPVSKFQMPQKRAVRQASPLSQALQPVGAAFSNKLTRAVAKENASIPTLAGEVIFADNWTEDNQPTGMYYLPTSAGAECQLKYLGGYSYGNTVLDGEHHSTDFFSFFGMAFITHSSYDSESGEVIAEFSGANFDEIFLDTTVDPTTGTVYGIGYTADGSGLQLASINFSESSVSANAIAPLEGTWNSIACDNQGQLYAIERDIVENGDAIETTGTNLYKLDKATGAAELVGPTGVLAHYITSSTIDPKTNRMFWTVSPASGEGQLYEVDLATGAATLLMNLPYNEEIVGLHVPAPLAEDGAPAAVENLTAFFENGSLSGHVNFTAPSTNYDGSAASGALTYKVLANGVEVATGSTSYGAEVAADVTVAASGNYEFVVTVENGVGASPKAKIKTFVGTGIPDGAKDVALAYADGQMNLTWAAPAGSVDGGYIDFDALTYTVVRDLDGAVVVDAQKVFSFSEAVAEPANITSYSYSVTVNYGDVKSEAVTSNAVVLGQILPPYSANFMDENEGAAKFDQFTILDNNGDGRTWTLYGSGATGGARVQYNSSMAMDDYLVTPPIKLEGGKKYLFMVDARANGSTFPETFEVVMGQTLTPEGLMDYTIIPATVLTNSSYETYEGVLEPETTGTYFVAIHGISDADMFYLYCNNIVITTSTTPAKPEIEAFADENGALKATINVTAPSVDRGGDALTSLTKVEVSRDGALIKTFENPAPGAALTFEDAEAKNGNNTYTAVAYNADGAGSEASVTVFVGFKLPAAPQNITMTEVGNTGEVNLSWDAVTTDVDGKALPEGAITYNTYTVEDGYWVPAVEGQAETTWNYQALTDPSEQDFVNIGVAATNQAGRSDISQAPFIPVGAPYTEFEESFDDGGISHIWGTGTIANEGSASLFDDDSFNGQTDADGTNGYAGFKGQYLDSSSRLFTGKISLEGETAPVLTFQSYTIVGESGEASINELHVNVIDCATRLTTEVLNTTVAEIGAEEGWHQASVSLIPFIGKTIQVEFIAVTKMYVYTFFDAVKIGTPLDNDLALSKISAPAKVATGADYQVEVSVKNLGALTQTAYTVDLYANGEKVASKEGVEIAAQDEKTFTFDFNMSAIATEAVTYKAEVVFAADEKPANNTSDEVTVAPKVSSLPAVIDLAGEGNTLTWSEPDLSNVAEDQFVDFEDADYFTTEYKDWVFVDVDQAPIGGMLNLDIPNFALQSLQSFIVFDATLVAGETTEASFAANSGTHYLASMFRYDDGQVDDWAISPALYGNAQTISFYAKSYSTQYPEKIEAYYSTGSTEPSDFVKVEAFGTVTPGKDWTKYEFDVPEGAVRFAIRSNATSSFMLELDDFSFQAGSGTADLSIVGYNVYRNGEKITAEPVAETTFTDENAPEGDNTYVVTVVYTNGESKPSNEVILAASGIAQVEAFQADAIYYNLNGVKVANPASGNIYIRKQGENVAKILLVR